jgi:hypothetical protein
LSDVTESVDLKVPVSTARITSDAQQFTVSRVGTAAAKRHQYAVGHIEVAPSLKSSDDVTGGPLFHHFWSTS